MSGERVSVKNLIKTLPLPYRDSLVTTWVQDSGPETRVESEESLFANHTGYLRINNLRNSLKTDIQSRAHGVVPILLLLWWFEVTAAPCIWCFLECLHRHSAWLKQWTIGKPSTLHTKLSKSLFAEIIVALERDSKKDQGEARWNHATEEDADEEARWLFTITCAARHTHQLTKTVNMVAHLELLERWGLPIRQMIVRYCLEQTAIAAKEAMVNSTVLNMIILTTLLGDQDQQSNSVKILAIMLERSPSTRRCQIDVIAEAIFRSRASCTDDHLVLLQNLFFRVPSERFSQFCAAAAKFRFAFPLISDLPEQSEALLSLTAHQVTRLCEFIQLRCAAPHQITLSPLLILWLQSTTVFDIDALLTALPSIPVALCSARSHQGETDFCCEIAECSLKLADHVMPEESYVKSFHELLIKTVEDSEPFSFLYELCSAAAPSTRGTHLCYVDYLQQFAGLDDARCSGITRFLHSGCLLDLISWFARNAHRLSASHLNWLGAIMRQLTITDGSYSSLVADIIMFLVEEQSVAMGNHSDVQEGTEEAQWLITASPCHRDVFLYNDAQVERSIHISKLLAVLCESGLFRLQTLMSMTKFIMLCETQVVPARRQAQWSLERRGSCQGFAMWVHCIQTLLRQIVDTFVPPAIRQYFSPDMPDVDESSLRVRGDIYRDLRELADTVIAAVHTRALNFSGDLRLEEATLNCLHWCLIIHTTCSISLLSRIHQIWMIVEMVLESPIISKVAIKTCWEVMTTAALHAAEFTHSTIGQSNIARYKARWPDLVQL